MGETLTRTLSGLIYIVLLTAAVFTSSYSFLLLFGMFLIITVVEFCDLIRLHKTLPVLSAIAAFFLFGYYPVSNLTLILLLAATLFVSIKCIQFLFDDLKQQADTVSKYTFVTGYVILPFILISKLPFQEDIYRPEIIFSIFILIWTNDTFAFIVGKTTGRTKLIEKISPKKTVEGFIGGVGFAMLAGLLLARFYLNESPLQWIIIALIVGVFGTVGDLVQSKFKRVAMVKDSGKIMPGHGGILDRLDSVIFAAPFVLLFYQILYYVS